MNDKRQEAEDRSAFSGDDRGDRWLCLLRRGRANPDGALLDATQSPAAYYCVYPLVR